MTSLFLDIETLPGETMPPLDEIEAPKNYKDEVKIQAYKEANQVDIWKKQALISHKGRILCIGYAFDNDKPEIISGTEIEIINQLEALLKGMGKGVFAMELVGHNIEFDLKFIMQKAFKFQNKFLINILPSKLRDERIKDTMKIFTLHGYKDFISLDAIATFLGLEGKGEIDGSKVFDYWKAGKLQEIYDYCKSDIELIRNIYINFLNI